MSPASLYTRRPLYKDKFEKKIRNLVWNQIYVYVFIQTETFNFYTTVLSLLKRFMLTPTTSLETTYDQLLH